MAMLPASQRRARSAPQSGCSGAAGAGAGAGSGVTVCAAGGPGTGVGFTAVSGPAVTGGAEGVAAGGGGAAVTVGNDSRITRVGAKIRDYRLDEIGQLINVLKGEMSFVGTRPEVLKYVKRYTPEMRATLLLPAGITSEASIRYKDESELLDAADDVDKVYVEKVLPGKMKWNLDSIRKFSFMREILTMFRTAAAVMGKEYE